MTVDPRVWILAKLEVGRMPDMVEGFLTGVEPGGETIVEQEHRFDVSVMLIQRIHQRSSFGEVLDGGACEHDGLHAEPSGA